MPNVWAGRVLLSHFTDEEIEVNSFKELAPGQAAHK